MSVVEPCFNWLCVFLLSLPILAYCCFLEYWLRCYCFLLHCIYHYSNYCRLIAIVIVSYANAVDVVCAAAAVVVVVMGANDDSIVPSNRFVSSPKSFPSRWEPLSISSAHAFFSRSLSLSQSSVSLFCSMISFYLSLLIFFLSFLLLSFLSLCISNRSSFSISAFLNLLSSLSFSHFFHLVSLNLLFWFSHLFIIEYFTFLLFYLYIS